MFPEAVMAQFDLSPEPDVSGEQSQDGQLRPPPGLLHHRLHPGQDAPLVLSQQMIEPENIGLETARKIFRRRIKRVPPENLARDGTVGPAGKLDSDRRAGDPEGGPKGVFEGAHAGPAGANQGTIDVEKDDFGGLFHKYGHVRICEIDHLVISEDQLNGRGAYARDDRPAKTNLETKRVGE